MSPLFGVSAGTSNASTTISPIKRFQRETSHTFAQVTSEYQGSRSGNKRTTDVIVIEDVDQHQWEEAGDEGEEDGGHHLGESQVLLPGGGVLLLFVLHRDIGRTSGAVRTVEKTQSFSYPTELQMSVLFRIPLSTIIGQSGPILGRSSRAAGEICGVVPAATECESDA